MNKDLTVFLERTHPRAAQIPLLVLTVVFPRYLCDRTTSFRTANGNVTFRTLLQALGQAGCNAPQRTYAMATVPMDRIQPRFLIADDHTIFAEALKVFLEIGRAHV